MKKIKELVDNIHEEIDGAHHYASLAIDHKDADRHLSDMYADMASQEMGHAKKMYDEIVSYTDEYLKTGQEVPVSMQAVWDWEKQKIADGMMKTQVMLDLYKK